MKEAQASTSNSTSIFQLTKYIFEKINQNQNSNMRY